MKNPLLGLNVSEVSQISTQTFVELANKTVTMPTLVTFWITFLLINLIFGLVVVKKHRGRFMLIWSATALLSFGVMALILFNPHFIVNSLDYIKTRLSF